MVRFRALWAVLILALLAVACSGGGNGPTLNPAPESSSTTTDPGALAFSGDDEPDAPDEPRPLRIGVPDLRIVALDQLDEANPTEVLIADLLTDGLTQRESETGHAAPALARSWTVSPDGLQWTFALDRVTFGDGTPISAAHVVDSLNVIARLGNNSLSGPNLSVVDGYDEVAAGTAEVMTGLEATDERTVVFTLTEPYAPLADLLTSVVFGVQPEDVARFRLRRRNGGSP